MKARAWLPACAAAHDGIACPLMVPAFPLVAAALQGTPKRWEAVTTYVRTRTLEEVVFMVKEKQGMSASRIKAQVRVWR